MDPGDTLESSKGVYKIDKKLGEGAFGKVYLADYTAKNASNSKQVAVKEIAFNEMDEKKKEECEKEGKLMEKISKSSTNQHIVKHLDSFIGKVVTGKFILWLAGIKSSSHGNLFIAMSYCSCGDLSSKIKENVKSGKQFDPEIVYDYIYQIADGINKLHKYNIVHRDLKPANILIAWENGNEVLKISDFGLVKVIDSLNITLNHSKLCGTRLYMSPEQHALTPCRFPVVDIWAIGIIFYELCIAPLILKKEMEDLWDRVVMNDQRAYLPNQYSTADTTWLNNMIAKDPSERMSSNQVRDEARGPDPPEWRRGASVAYFKEKLYYLGGEDPYTTGREKNRVDLLMVVKVEQYIDYQMMNGNGLKLERFQEYEIYSESHH
ncbi:hypothetical protein WR25_05492 [Diploscapter pachys]|uniref:Protein kinase domain-containing protein n=1 Tax=Diploscapter pachys TaxID=2018661 RepID=A0A2A2LXH6_9BILA|nr:hypothetical protein WR25_05492 [Diploscapter pachys]